MCQDCYDLNNQEADMIKHFVNNMSLYSIKNNVSPLSLLKVLETMYATALETYNSSILQDRLRNRNNAQKQEKEVTVPDISAQDFDRLISG